MSGETDAELKRLYPGGVYICADPDPHDPHAHGRRGWCPGVAAPAGERTCHDSCCFRCTRPVVRIAPNRGLWCHTEPTDCDEFPSPDPAPSPSIPDPSDERRRFFLDTEFIEDGERIHPLAVAIVTEDGDAMYAVLTDTDRSLAGEWVTEHVLPYLDHQPEGATCTRGNQRHVARFIREWVAERSSTPEFWADYGAYDWVLLCQLFGTMLDLPDGWPMFVRDIQQIRNGETLPDPEHAHQAVSDALNARDRWRILAAAARPTSLPEAPEPERVVLTEDGSPAGWMPLESLMRFWRPGSADVREHDGGPWTWQDEHDRLWFQEDQGRRMDMLASSIMDLGIQQPVLLAADGRLWDGHHRICVAMRLAIEMIPFEFVQDNRPHDPTTAAASGGDGEGTGNDG